jgi:flagellar protein FliO/FliZ
MLACAFMLVTLSSPVVFANGFDPVQDPIMERIDDVVLGLIVVIGLIFLAARIGRRFLNLSQGFNGVFEVQASISLGPRSRIVLLRVGDQQILAGVSETHISSLQTLEVPLELPQPSATSAPASTGGLMALRDLVRKQA